jgi:hypothetical protein
VRRFLFFLLLIAIACAGFALFSGQSMEHATREFESCDANVRTLANALVLYSYEHRSYPSRLDALIPKYMPSIPTCPSAGVDTYSAAYARSVRSEGGQSFTLCCEGAHHVDAGAAPDHPAYSCWHPTTRDSSSPSVRAGQSPF